MRIEMRQLSLVMAVLLSVFVGIASAQQTATTTETKKFEVIAVDGNQLVVRLPEGTREITAPAGFTVNVAGKQVPVSQLKPGMSGTATITTTTTVKPVTVTEVKSGTVERVVGNSIIVVTDQGYKMFSEGDVEKRGVKIIRDGQPVRLADLRAGDRLTATIVTEKPPQVMTQQQVQATVTGGAAAPAATGATKPVPSAASPATAQAPAATAKKTLPKTASPLPLLGVIGAASAAAGVLLASRRRRRTTK